MVTRLFGLQYLGGICMIEERCLHSPYGYAIPVIYVLNSARDWRLWHPNSNGHFFVKKNRSQLLRAYGEKWHLSFHLEYSSPALVLLFLCHFWIGDRQSTIWCVKKWFWMLCSLCLMNNDSVDFFLVDCLFTGAVWDNYMRSFSSWLGVAEFIYGGVSSQKVGYIENLGAILGNCFCLQSVDQFYLRGTIGSLIIRLLFFFFLAC